MQQTQRLVAGRPDGLTVRGGAADAFGQRLLRARRVLNVLSDAALAWLAFWISYLLRYHFNIWRPIQPADWEPFSTFAGKADLFVVLVVAIFFVRGLYRLPRSTGLLDEASTVTGGLTTAMAGVILIAFFGRSAPSRLVFLYAWGCAFVLLLLKRAVARAGWHWLWAHGIGVERVLVVGAGQSGRRIMQAFMSQPSLGYHVVGFVDDDAAGDAVGVATEHRVARAERLGTADDVGAIVAREGIDEVVVALPGNAHDRLLRIIDQCRAHSVRFKVVPDLVQMSLDRVDLGEVAGVPLIGVKGAAIGGANYALKRTVDVVVAIVVLAVMAVPMGAIAMIIRRDSPGPVLYRQVRIGRHGEPFTCVKFRCMVEDADALRATLMAENGHTDPRLFKLREDPRLTGVGRVLRRWSLDELPQFLHVLRGQMSLVGPRPQLPEEVAQYEDWHRQRLLVTPGLTGLWQVNGRSDLTFGEMVRLDLYYAEHWSPWLEMRIVLRTIPAVLSGRGAY